MVKKKVVEMETAVVKTRAGGVVDARQMQAIFKKLQTLDANDRTVSREIVHAMAESNEATVLDLLDRVRSELRDLTDRSKRMAACAKCGLREAYHLYGPVKKLTHVEIELAHDSAIAALADPEAEVQLVQSDGSAVTRTAGELGYSELRSAWDPKHGMLPVKRQREALERRKAVRQVERQVYHVRSVREDGGKVIVELDGCSVPVELTDKDARLIAQMLG